MLIDFTVENFRSIKEPITLSAVAQKSKAASSESSERRNKPDNEIAPPFVVEGWGFDLLPALGIFGANASGKSNVLFALNCLLDYVVFGSGFVSNYGIIPFMLDGNNQNLPTRFEIRVAVHEAIYTYSLHLTKERVVYEKLDYALAATKKERRLFQRSWNKTTNEYDWENGRYFAGPHTQLEMSVGERDTFMNLLPRLEIPVFNPFKQWITHRIPGVGHGREERDEVMAAITSHQKPERLEKISDIIRLFDTGISRFEIVKSNLGGAGNTYEIWAWHKTEQGEVKFPILLESAGTRRLFGIANHLLTVFDSGSLMLVDELGSNIHPNITRAIVQMFQSPRTNPKRAQLIFTSHDNTLQRNYLLRRDQIWFTQKRPDGSTELYPLSDFKPRCESLIDKSYLDGRYGAVPVLPDEEEFAFVTAGEC